MRCVILAGGEGTRLFPYTATLPKPLVPIGNHTILEIIIMQLNKAGVRRITIAVNHLAHLIQSYFDDGSRWDIEIDYSIENQPLSTIAPLKLIHDLPQNFIVMNGDVLTDITICDLYEYHLKKDADVTVATYNRQSMIDFGVIEIGPDNLVEGFQEKPVYNFFVSMGVYVINRRILEAIPESTPYGFDNLLYDCIENKRRVYSYLYSGNWLDIGRPDDYARAQNEIGAYLEALGL